MDTDICKMFKDKNKEILKNSLKLEMERNLETLKNTTDNCVALEINKMFLFFKSYFNEINIEYKKEDLLGFLYRERKDINDIVNAEIENKKNVIINEYLSKDTEEILTEEYLDNYYALLKEQTEIINDKIEVEVKKQISTEFTPELIKKYKLETQEQSDRINSRINILFRENIISKIKDQIIFRDESLRNMMKESYNKYVELNKSTVDKNVEN